MLVEAPILGGENRLDQMFGKIFECGRIVMADSAPSDLVAVAVLEHDGEVLRLQPVVPAHFAEGRDGQGQHEQQADDAERERLAGQLDADALGAANLQPVHALAVPLPAGSTARVRLRCSEKAVQESNVSKARTKRCQSESLPRKSNETPVGCEMAERR